ncbi:MAG TPA: hypothetical protein VJN48_00060 [Terriglobales bacterium]|nr:hypothetical protein [Terriglobales bacterium]
MFSSASREFTAVYQVHNPQKSVRLTGIGILSGVVFSASAASTMANLLYGVRPHDLGYSCWCLCSYSLWRLWPAAFPMIALRDA